MGIFGLGKPNVEAMKARRDVKGLVDTLGYEKDLQVAWNAMVALVQIGPQAVPALWARLSDNGWANNPTPRWMAAIALGNLGDSRAAPELLDCMKKGNVFLANYATLALGMLGNPAAQGHLVADICDTSRPDYNPTFAAAALEGLRRIGSAGALTADTLIKLRRVAVQKEKHPHSEMCLSLLRYYGLERARKALLPPLLDQGDFEAAWTLEMLGWEPGNDQEQIASLIAKRRWDECASLPGPLVDRAPVILKSDDLIGREAVIHLMGQVYARTEDQQIHNRITGILSGLMFGADKKDSEDALKAARNAGIADGVLIDACRKGDQSLWMKALQMLEDIKSAHAFDLLVEALDKSDAAGRRDIIRRLGRTGDARAVPVLCRAIGDKDIDCRVPAAEALGNFRDPAATEALIAALSDSQSALAEQAAVSLGRLKDLKAVVPLVSGLWKMREYGLVADKIEQAIAEIGDPSTIPAIMALQPSVNYRTLERFARILDRLGWQPGADEAGAAYWAGKGDFEACARIGVPAVRPLAIALINTDGTAGKGWKGTSAKALSAIGAPAAAPLAAFLRADNPWFDANKRYHYNPKHIFEALVTLGAAAIEPLAGLLDTEDRQTCGDALRALGRIGTRTADAGVRERILGVLSGAMGRKDWVIKLTASEVMDTMGHVPAGGTEQAVYLIRNERIAECVALGAAATPALVDRIAWSRATPALLTALGTIGDPAALDTLLRGVQNESWDNRKAAANALFALYHSSRLSEGDRQKILAVRSAITEGHVDKYTHTEIGVYRSSDCNDHTDDNVHTDTGIGIPFPL